ncbi:MAG: MerR family transcriptional regulator [Dehalococcoidia bacterium]|nr:MerR family transcriptional regulator [Dehalococcoidia bacterium]MDD5495418.1 MerR family transcriptional regulator [Dehalococcoidia bacterium]
MPREGNEPKYVISIAARILGCEIHTLRYYEKLGLIQPYRSEGNIRYYSEIDLERLRHVKVLMDDMGVNMAGVEVIMRLGEKLAEMQHRIDSLEAELKKLQRKEAGGKKIKSGG